MVLTAETDLLLHRFWSPLQPYRWQERLLENFLLRSQSPSALDLPTGLGKTKVIALWLIAKMVGTQVPRRLVYIVDRRAVVDQASAEAQALTTALAGTLADESIEGSMRDRWRRNLGLRLGEELPISTLRGQFIDNRKWLARPHSAAIVVGTVDMIGSRLLFGGYGVSRRMRAVHAALLGNDALLVLDEAHLVPPFEGLLRRTAELADAARKKAGDIVPPLRVVSLSATGREIDGAQAFQLAPEDETDPLLRERLAAEKRLLLRDEVEAKQLPAALAERAWEVAEGRKRVIVFCNSRVAAQAVEEELASRVRREYGKDAKRTELFVGERRVRERLRLYDKSGDSVFARFLPNAPPGEEALFLVATSAAEVGVDLDSDALVCDLVPWERMVQRFGRVNRRPVPGRSTIDIIPAVSEKDAEDEVSLDRLARLRAPFESTEWETDAEGRRQASPLALRRLKTIPAVSARLASAESPAPFHPELSPALLDAWSMTWLREHPGRPLLQPWLRGWIESPPQTRIVWRRLFPLRAGEENDATSRDTLAEFFEAAPPHVTEILEAPTDRAVAVFKKRAEAIAADRTREPFVTGPVHAPVIVVLDPAGDLKHILTLHDIENGIAAKLQREWKDCTIVVDARFGGLSEKGLLDPKADQAPPTSDGDESEWGLKLEDTVQRRLRWGEWSRARGDWRFGGFRWKEFPEADNGDELWIEVWRGPNATAGDRAVARRAQALSDHHSWTREEAEAIATALGLPPEKALMLCSAAAFHDAGKDRDLWQNAMNAPRSGRPFAKTIGGAVAASLAGYRHEFGSLGDAETDAAIRSLPAADRELARHVVASHHGRARPTIPALDPLRPPSHSSALAQQAALRFVALQETWGHWGLAWWEALLQAADSAASSRNDSAEASDV